MLVWFTNKNEVMHDTHPNDLQGKPGFEALGQNARSDLIPTR
jgi:hypothetical protein